MAIGLGLILIITAAILVFVVLVAMGVVFIMLVKWLDTRGPSGPPVVGRAQQAAHGQVPGLEAEAAGFFSGVLPGLLPWERGALSDLASRWEGGRSGFITGLYRGVVKSLGHMDKGRLAFYFVMKWSHGVLLLRTGHKEVRLDFAGGYADVTVDGRLFGGIQARAGGLFDVGGQPAGRYHRYTGMRLKMGSMPLSTNYGAVEIGGRQVARMCDALIWGVGPFAEGSRSRQLIVDLVPDVTEEEENWLLALVALELYHDAVRSRNR